MTAKKEVATLGGGCFWCVETVFNELKGVYKATSGYMGGHIENPTYKMVCTGETGHAEVVQVEFDPGITSYEDILNVFWAIHNPTTLNRQGNDIGTQYRSAIFYHSDDQKIKAEHSIKEVASKLYDDPIVTEITKAGEFWEAEAYHQGYYKQNPNQGYCSMVVGPKVAKFRSKFKNMLKDGL